MASGAKNQLRLVNVLGAPTLRDGSVGRWDGKERFFSRWFYRWWAPVSSDSSKCALPEAPRGWMRGVKYAAREFRHMSGSRMRSGEFFAHRFI